MSSKRLDQTRVEKLLMFFICIDSLLCAGKVPKGWRKKIHVICPIVSIYRFCYLQTCGCVFSDRAMKEVKTEICHKVSNISLFPPKSLYSNFLAWTKGTGNPSLWINCFRLQTSQCVTVALLVLFTCSPLISNAGYISSLHINAGSTL